MGISMNEALRLAIGKELTPKKAQIIINVLHGELVYLLTKPRPAAVRQQITEELIKPYSVSTKSTTKHSVQLTMPYNIGHCWKYTKA